MKNFSVICVLMILQSLWSEEYNYLVFATEFGPGDNAIAVFDLTEGNVLYLATAMGGVVNAKMIEQKMSGIEGFKVNLNVKEGRIHMEFDTSDHVIYKYKLEPIELIDEMKNKNAYVTYGKEKITGVTILTKSLDWKIYLPDTIELLKNYDMEKFFKVMIKLSGK